MVRRVLAHTHTAGEQRGVSVGSVLSYGWLYPRSARRNYVECASTERRNSVSKRMQRSLYCISRNANLEI